MKIEKKCKNIFFPGWSAGETLKCSAVIFSICTAICTYTATPQANIVMRNITFMAFLMLETSIGLYFPSIGVLRSQVRYKFLKKFVYYVIKITTHFSYYYKNPTLLIPLNSHIVGT